MEGRGVPSTSHRLNLPLNQPPQTLNALPATSNRDIDSHMLHASRVALYNTLLGPSAASANPNTLLCPASCACCCVVAHMNMPLMPCSRSTRATCWLH